MAHTLRLTHCRTAGSFRLSPFIDVTRNFHPRHGRWQQNTATKVKVLGLRLSWRVCSIDVGDGCADGGTSNQSAHRQARAAEQEQSPALAHPKVSSSFSLVSLASLVSPLRRPAACTTSAVCIACVAERKQSERQGEERDREMQSVKPDQATHEKPTEVPTLFAALEEAISNQHGESASAESAPPGDHTGGRYRCLR